MLLANDPSVYNDLAGVPDRIRLLIGKRIEADGGNGAIHRHFSDLSAGRKDWTPETEDRLFAYLESGNHPNPAFGKSAISPELRTRYEKTLSDHNEAQRAELWTLSLDCLAIPGLQLERMRRWCPWLAVTSAELVRLYEAGEMAKCLDRISALEYSDAKSIQFGMERLRCANSQKAIESAVAVLHIGTLLFEFACLDADTTNLFDGSSWLAGAMPRSENKKTFLPMSRWMDGMRRILELDTQNDVTSVLLKYKTGSLETVRREGKRYWSGEKLPSHSTFSTMVGCAKDKCPERADDLDEMLRASFFITFLHNLYWEIQNSNQILETIDPLFFFADYPYYYEIARSSNGPAPG